MNIFGGISFFRVLIAVVMIGALFATLSWLQGRYNASDHEKAVHLVQTYRAMPKGPTIPEVLLARHPGSKDHQFSWASEITSTFMGVVRVSAFLPSAPATYAFDVRLTDFSIHPTDPATIEVLKALTISTTTTSTTYQH